MHKVSICIPVYNVEKYIERCLLSVLTQTYEDIEVIIVNDCTPDNSMQIVRRYVERDKRVKIIEHDHNKGLMCARETAYKAAEGDYITFCDSDDVLPADSIEKLVRAIRENEVDIASGCIEFIYNNGTKRKWEFSLKYGRKRQDVLRSLFLKEYGHNLCSKLFKREVLQNNQFLIYENFTNAEDGLLFYQIVNNIELGVVAIPDVVYHYYENMESATHRIISDKSLQGVVRFYDYVNKCTSEDEIISELREIYLTKELNEFLLLCGKRRLIPLLDEHNLARYVSAYSRVKYMTLRENIRWMFKRFMYILSHND